MVKFLKGLETFGNAFLDKMNANFAPGENVPRTLDATDPNDPDKMISYGALGEFAKQVDPRANRSYVESGYIRNVKSKPLQIITQEPDLNVVIKKRFISSLANNYKLELSDKSEKLFMKASKILFKNKCQAISSYEKLTKYERIIQNQGTIDELIFPRVLEEIEGLDALDIGITLISGSLRNVLNKIKKVMNFSEPSQFTTWNYDKARLLESDLGDGAGTFDFTMVSGINTTSSLLFAGGKAGLNIEDPYNLMTITEQDIDKAIADSTNAFKQASFFSVSEESLRSLNETLKLELNLLRKERQSNESKTISNNYQKYNKVKLSDEQRSKYNVPGIIFKLNEDSIFGLKQRVIIDIIGKELEFEYDPGTLGFGGKAKLVRGKITDPGYEVIGLTEVEQIKAEQIVSNNYQLMNIKKQKDALIEEINLSKENDYIQYVRDKMRLHYANKLIIQPMDTVHIFISSKKQDDDMVVGFNTKSAPLDILSGISKGISNITEQINSIASSFTGSVTSFEEIEKNITVGSDFPMWLWKSVRNNFTKQTAGIQVFGGVVVNSSSSYSDGKWTVSVNCSDNCYYLQQGQINVNPALDIVDSAIYDPLTPFKEDYNLGTGRLLSTGKFPELLEENNRLLFSSAIKMKAGVKFAGASINPSVYYNSHVGERVRGPEGLNYRNVIYEPDGFVYRWKTGIGVLTLSHEPHPSGGVDKNYSQSFSKSPFAGQDAMNVISLLITGLPYNFNNFIKSAIETGNLTKESIDQLNGNSKALLKGIITDINRNNLIWGNFIPFKEMITNEKEFQYLQNSYDKSLSLISQQEELKTLIERRAKILDANAVLASSNVATNNNNTSDLSAATKTSQNDGLNDKIESIITNIKKNIQNPNIQSGIKIYGDDITYDPSFSESNNESSENERKRQRQNFRNKVNSLLLRRYWKVKANEDVNYFIVDDQYDKNYDIQAFSKEIGQQWDKFKSQYSDVATNITNVTKILGLEVYADTQGHIRCKAPSYNKVPSSVFLRMLRETKKGKRFFPKTLESLFIDNKQRLVEKIEIVEDLIRLHAYAYSYSAEANITNDLSISTWLMSNLPLSTDAFEFITDENGNFIDDVILLNNSVSPDSTEDKFKSNNKLSLKALFSTPKTNEDIKEKVKQLAKLNSKIYAQVKLQAVFDQTRRYDILKRSIKAESRVEGNTKNFDNVRNRLIVKRESNVKTLQELVPTGAATNLSTRINILNQLAALISERQELLKNLHSTLKNIREGYLIDSDPDQARALLDPNLGYEIPELMSNMIEDENIDDLGFNSGKRYVIEDKDIISMTIEETPPAYTSIECSGLFGDGLAKPPTDLTFGQSGGNQITTAISVDYDLWRMYGWKTSETLVFPYLKDPETQLAPLAVFLLNLERRKILTGNLTVVGNEYYQPGDVIYIESKDLLFYVETVSHNFSFGGSFQTTLTLKYGHNPGEYIPNILDIIGKALFSNSKQSNLARNDRGNVSNGEEGLMAFAVNSYSENTDTVVDSLLEGKFGSANKGNLANLLRLASQATINSGTRLVIKLRIYTNSKQNIIFNTNTLINIAKGIKKWIKNPEVKEPKPMGGLKRFLVNQDVDNPKSIPKFNTQLEETEKTHYIDDSAIKIEIVNLADGTISNVDDSSTQQNPIASPSSYAFYLARSIADDFQNFNTSKNSGYLEKLNKEESLNYLPELGNSNPQIKVDQVIYNYIIDVWSGSEDVPDNLQTSKEPDRGTSSESQNNKKEKLNNT